MAATSQELAIVLRAKDEASAVLAGAAKNTEAQAAGMSKSFAAIGNAAKLASVAMVGIGVAAIGVATKGVTMAAEFEKGMAEVATLSGDVQKNLPALTKGVLDLSAAMGKDATASAKALYQAISAGVPPENALNFLAVASKAAIAGVTDTETAVNGITSAVNAFAPAGLQAGQAADIMFATVKAGKTDFAQLSASMANVAPIASTLGVSFAETSAAMATLTLSGTQTSVASTQIRAALIALAKPTDELGVIFKRAGLASGEAAIKQLGFAGAADIVSRAAGGSVAALTPLLGSSEAVAAVLGVTGDKAKTFAGVLDGITNSSGATDEAFGLMSKTMSQQMAVASESLNRVFILIGQKLLPVITPMITAFAKWLPVAFVVLERAADQLHPVLSAVGTVLGMIGRVIVPLLTTALAVLLAPVVGLTLAVVVLRTKWNENWARIHATVVTVAGALGDALGWIGDRAGDLADAFGRAFGWIMDRARDLFNMLPGFIRDRIGDFGDFGRGMIGNFQRGLAERAPGMLRLVGEFADGIGETIGTVVADVRLVGADLIGGLGAGMESMQGWLGGQLAGLGALVPEQLRLGAGDVEGIGISIPADLASGIEKGAGAAKSAAEALGRGVQTAVAGTIGQISGDLLATLRRMGLVTAGGQAIPGGAGAAGRIVASVVTPGGMPGPAFAGSFAHGGTVPGPLGQPRLVVAHGGEQIGNGRGVTIIFNAPVYGMLDFEQQIKRIVRDAFPRVARA